MFTTLQAFMVWKYPTRKPNSGTEQHSDHGPPTLTNEEFDKVMRGKTKSIYQSDFKGLPPGAVNIQDLAVGCINLYVSVKLM